jgi:pyochelin biosynthesis protein PchC
MAVNGRDDWIRVFHPVPDPEATLLCLPHAGGSASYYFPLSRALMPRVEVLAAQYPGRQDRRHEPAVAEIPALADQIVDALARWEGRKIAVFGHSMGATVGFEVVRRLERDASRGPLPIRLIVSARRAPSLPDCTAVHQMDDNGIVAELRRLKGTDDGVFMTPELLSMIIPVIRGDYKAIETYTCPPGVAVRCPVTAFLGDADPMTSREQVAGWSNHTLSEFKLRVFAGGHFYLDSWGPEIVSEISGSLPA